MKSAIVTTTINVPKLLENYIKNVKQYKHDCIFIIIGDKKTPPEAKPYCLKLQKKYNVELEYLDVDDQVEYLKRFPELGEHLVFNSIQRRNIGMLLAYEKNVDFIITIDDDNFFLSSDFVKHHTVGLEKKMEVISSSTGWLNVCDYLKEKKGRSFYHRGYPPEVRFLKENKKSKTSNVKIVVNAGFWLGEPDIDALTRLYYQNDPITATKYLRKSSFALAKDTWSPFNSQNTSIAREVIPAYFLSPYIGRYDDIWAAYVIKKIADYKDHYISFGTPIVNQDRNPHNFWKDLAKEDNGMMLTTVFTDMLKSIKLTKKDYLGCLREIADGLTKKLEKQKITPEHQAFLKKYFDGMYVWIKTFERLEKVS